MIRHFVLFRLHPGVARDGAAVASAVALMERLGRELEYVREWRFGPNLTDREVAYDYAATFVLDDPMLDRYLADPRHRKVSEAWREISELVVADLREPEVRQRGEP